MGDCPLFGVLEHFKVPDDITTINNNSDSHDLLSAHRIPKHRAKCYVIFLGKG